MVAPIPLPGQARHDDKRFIWPSLRGSSEAYLGLCHAGEMVIQKQRPAGKGMRQGVGLFGRGSLTDLPYEFG